MKRNDDKRLKKALELVARLMTLSDDKGLQGRAVQIRDRLLTPMAEVLAKVKGSSVTEKCARIGVTRQAYYGWLNGGSRPSAKQAKKLAELTGLDPIQIRGRTRISAPPVKPRKRGRPSAAALRAAAAARAARGA